MQTNTEVVVVGAGVIGCATAYYLSKAGAKVLVVDKTGIGSGASGHSAGGLAVSLHFSEPLEHVQFMRQAINLLKWIAPRIEEETAIDLLWRDLPWLEVTWDEGIWRYMQKWAPKIKSRTILSREEVLRIEPRITTDILGGHIEEGAGQLDSYRLTFAFAKAARASGAEFAISEATGLTQLSGRVTGIQTTTGRIACERVVLALGAWTGKTEEWLGIPMPIEPLKGDMIYLKYPGKEHWPYYIMGHGIEEEGELPTLLHMRADGLLFAGVTAIPGQYDLTPSKGARESIVARANRLMPSTLNSEVIAHTAGPRPSPRDGMTVIGSVPGLEGAYVSATLPGIICSALMGHTITELIYDRPPLVPIELFNPDRFSKPVTEMYGYNKPMAQAVI